MFAISPIINSPRINHDNSRLMFLPHSNGRDIFVSTNKVSFGSKNSNQETIDWYNKNAQKYFNETKDRAMDDEYIEFLKYIPKGSDVLDAGCGSGRDAKNFSDMGYKVTAFDASSELSKLASKFTGLNVTTDTFADFKSPKKFDGIWACTSLLHVPKKDFQKSFSNLVNHLKENGVIFAYMKAGTTEEKDSKGRFFNYVSVDELKKIFSKFKNLKLMKISQTENDFRVGDHPFIEFVVKKIKH